MDSLDNALGAISLRENNQPRHSKDADIWRLVEELQNQVKNNKTFLYMVIHDLKHPTDSAIS